ncbi:MAG: hypothetical protein AABZ30_01980 [Myxococcota bacterium]
MSRALAALLAAACGNGGATSPRDGAAADGSPPDAAVAFVLESGLPETSLLAGAAQARGWRDARGIIHLHTPYSHDACDGMPRADGKTGAVNEPCYQDLRAGLCATRQDFAMTTDHEETAAIVDYQELLLLREGDQAVAKGDATIGNRIDCGDGFRPLLLPGGEFGAMPVGMERHIDGTPEARDALYNQESAENVAALKGVGAVVLQAHPEGRTLAALGGIGLDGMEVYNLHAAIDPDIRGPDLGLDPFAAIESVAAFFGRDEESPHPDLALLGFLEDQQVTLDKWDALLALGPMVGVAGTDAHQNVLPQPLLRDGERTDSYRRMMRWFANHVLVPAGDAPLDPDELKAALAAGRAYVAFETLGSPVGFDFRAETAGGEIVEMGDVAPAGATLRVTRPTIHGWSGTVAARMRILRATTDGATEVAQGDGDELAHVAGEAGAYRAEVRLVPEHLAPHLGPKPETYLHEYPWIYANAIRVE